MLRKLLRLKKINPVPLGRWKPSKNNSLEQLRKIDLANCDSCGTCTTNETKKTEVTKQKIIIDDEFINYNIDVIPYHTLGH